MQTGHVKEQLMPHHLQVRVLWSEASWKTYIQNHHPDILRCQSPAGQKTFVKSNHCCTAGSELT